MKTSAIIRNLFEEKSSKPAGKPSATMKTDVAPAGGADVAAQLSVVVDSTRSFIRRLERLEEVAAEMSDLATKAEKIRRDGGVERSMRRNTISNAMRKWQPALSGIYGDFAKGRDAMTALAKSERIPTKRFGKKSASVPVDEISKTDLVREMNQIAKALNGAIREAGELGSLAIRKAEEIKKRVDSGKLAGDKLVEELGALTALYLDFRDQVSGALFGMIGGITKRLNGVSAALDKLNFGESEEWGEAPAMLHLPWELDEQCSSSVRFTKVIGEAVSKSEFADELGELTDVLDYLVKVTKGMHDISDRYLDAASDKAFNKIMTDLRALAAGSRSLQKSMKSGRSESTEEEGGSLEEKSRRSGPGLDVLLAGAAISAEKCSELLNRAMNTLKPGSKSHKDVVKLHESAAQLFDKVKSAASGASGMNADLAEASASE